MDAKTLRALQQRELTKGMQTLQGLVAGLVADGQLNDTEIHFLRTWLSENASLRSTWPASAIHSKMEAALADGVIDDAEREHLLGVLQDFGTSFATDGSASPAVLALPINDEVSVSILYSAVCHTGVFYYGTRAACERATLKAGGVAVDNVTRKTDILVVGSQCSPDWANTTWGRKIEAAVRLQEGGHEVEIISEQRWLAALQVAAA